MITTLHRMSLVDAVITLVAYDDGMKTCVFHRCVLCVVYQLGVVHPFTE